jgi:hypothetical protein
MLCETPLVEASRGGQARPQGSGVLGSLAAHSGIAVIEQAPASTRGGGHGQDGDERLAAATRGTRVGDAGQVGEQVQSLGFLERVGITPRVKTRWERG